MVQCMRSCLFLTGKLPVVNSYQGGYTFIGWRELYNDKAPIWNENTDVVTRDIAHIRVQKGTVNYTVAFNSTAVLLLSPQR